MVRESDNDIAYWEPWQPQAGQVVRIRINPECKDGKHRQAQDGRLAEVVYIWPLEDLHNEPHYNGHRFYVDTGLWLTGAGGWYSAGELDPVEE